MYSISLVLFGYFVLKSRYKILERSILAIVIVTFFNICII